MSVHRNIFRTGRYLNPHYINLEDYFMVQARCHPLIIHMSGYQLGTLKLPLCGDQEKNGKTAEQLNLFTFG